MLFGFNNKYPYTDFHELNLDWILTQIRELNIAMDSFVNVNTIKYADPLLWDITKQYEQNTLVQDALGMTYLSKKPVPVGISISNTDYWLKVADFDAYVQDIKASITEYDEGQGTTASADRYVNDLVWLSNELYVVTADIPAGSTYVTGTNCEHITIAQLVFALYYNIKRNITIIDEGKSPTATADRYINDIIWLDETLYIMTADIVAGTAYVPGTNCDQVTIADLIDTRALFRSLENSICPVNEGDNTTASAPRAVGDILWVNDILYEVISAMIAGDTYVPGSNIQATSIQEYSKTLYDDIINLFNTTLTVNDLNVGGNVTVTGDTTLSGDLQYKDPVSGTYFDTVEVNDTNGTPYNVMIENANTANMGARSQIMTSRVKLGWYNSTKIRAYTNKFYMNGFRVWGQNTKEGRKLYTSGSNFYTLFDHDNDIDVLQGFNRDGWYALFVVPDPNDPDKCIPKVVPYFRVSALSGTTLTLAGTKMGTVNSSLVANLKSDLAGRDVLVINGGGQGLIGTVGKIVSNTPSTITMDSVGAYSGVDGYILIAPEGSDYGYVGSAYSDTVDWKNRQDNGFAVKFLDDIDRGDAAYSANTHIRITNKNDWCPLATGIMYQMSCALQTSGTGALAFYAGADSGHDTMVEYYHEKVSATTETVYSPFCQTFFDYIQHIYIQFICSFVTPTNMKFRTFGWFEP